MEEKINVRSSKSREWLVRDTTKDKQKSKKNTGDVERESENIAGIPINTYTVME